MKLIVLCISVFIVTINEVKTDQSEIPPDILVNNNDATENVVISDVSNIQKDNKDTLSEDVDFKDDEVYDDDDDNNESVKTEEPHNVETNPETISDVKPPPESIEVVDNSKNNNAKTDTVNVDENLESVHKSRAGKSRSGNYYQYDDFLGGLDVTGLGGDQNYDYSKFFHIYTKIFENIIAKYSCNIHN